MMTNSAARQRDGGDKPGRLHPKRHADENGDGGRRHEAVHGMGPDAPARGAPAREGRVEGLLRLPFDDGDALVAQLPDVAADQLEHPQRTGDIAERRIGQHTARQLDRTETARSTTS